MPLTGGARDGRLVSGAGRTWQYARRSGVLIRATLRRVTVLRSIVLAAHGLRQRVRFWREYTPDRHVLEHVIFPR